VSVAPILLFLLFVILPASGKSERIIFIDPRDCDDSQEGHNKSPYRGDLQRNVNSLNLPEDGVPPPNLSTSADEAPTLGNTNINININAESSSNVTIEINSNSNGGNNGQSTPPGEPDADVTAVNSSESLPATTEIVIGTWNIQSGRNSRLETALRALGVVGVDLAFLTETKLTDGIYTRFSSDYHVLATNAASRTQGGVALVYRDSPYWQVESAVLHGPNVISAEIVSGNKRYGIVGAYIPPKDSTTSVHVTAALDRFASRRRQVILVGDLNINLDSPESERDVEIAQLLANAGLRDMHHHFKTGRRRSSTWHQKRNEEIVWSRPDYFLGTDRRIIRKYKIRDPRHFVTDHKLVCGYLISNELKENKNYLKGRTLFPHRTPKMGPSSKMDSLFQDIETAGKPTSSERRQGPRSGWISDETWRIVDQKNAFRRSPGYNQTEYRCLNRRLKLAFKSDRKRRCATAGALAEAELSNGNTREAWTIVRSWYSSASCRPPSPSREDLKKVTDDRINLYTKDATPDALPILVAPFDISDDVPDDCEIAEAVKKLRNGKAPGPSKVRAEKLKEWLKEATRKENPDSENWDRLTELVKLCFKERRVPTQLSWSTVVLIPKGGGDYRGIGLLEIVWKVIESIINRRIAGKVHFHDSLHGFIAKRGTGTACIEAKLLQQLSKMVQKTLYYIFLDLRKAYDTVDRERLLEILEGYGVGPNTLGLLKFYWENQRCVARSGNYHGSVFVPERGVTQGGIISPILFNILVDAVVRKWYADVMEDMTSAVSGLEGDAIRDRASLFYADDGAIGSRDPEWLQNATQHLCDLFRNCTGLKPNTNKTEVMICHPGEIRDGCSMEGYKRRHEGTGDNYRKRRRTRVECHICEKDLSAGSLQSHLRTVHGIDGTGSIIVAPVAPAPRTYRLSFRHSAVGPRREVICPVDGCLYRAKAASLLRRHFFYRHHTASLHNLDDGNVPIFCPLCGISVSLFSVQKGHVDSVACKNNVRHTRKRERIQTAAQAQARVFTIDGDELKKAENFKYLGRQISSRDSDFPALFLNLSKARKRLTRISRLLTRDGASPVVGGKFYVAAILSVLLYGSETWVWSLRMLNTVRGFHHRASRCLAGERPTRQQDGTYEYCPADEAMKTCGLRPIQVYIARRRKHALTYVETRPIYQLCKNSKRSPGTPSRTVFWWEQDLSGWIELEKDGCAEARVIHSDGV